MYAIINLKKKILLLTTRQVQCLLRIGKKEMELPLLLLLKPTFGPSSICQPVLGKDHFHADNGAPTDLTQPRDPSIHTHPNPTCSTTVLHLSLTCYFFEHNSCDFAWPTNQIMIKSMRITMIKIVIKRASKSMTKIITHLSLTYNSYHI